MGIKRTERISTQKTLATKKSTKLPKLKTKKHLKNSNKRKPAKRITKLKSSKKIMMAESKVKKAKISLKSNKKKRTIYKRAKSKSYSYAYYALHLIILIIFISFIRLDIAFLEKPLSIINPTDNITLSLNKHNTFAVKPSEIVIPTVDIKAKVTKATKDSFDNQEDYDGFEETANFVEDNKSIDEVRGHTLIYAHAKPKLFAKLPNISISNYIYVIGDDNNIYQYKVLDIQTIFPEDIDKVESLGDTNLQLITCQGDEDQYRLLVNAKLINSFLVDHKEVI